MRREEECGGVRSVYLPKESDSRLPANNPFLLLHFSESFCVLFCLLPYFSPSLSPRACFQKRPCQFTVTLHHLFSLFLIFLFHLPAFPFSIKYTWAFAGRPVFLSFLSFKHSLMFSSTTVTAFYLDISKPRRSLSPGKMSQLYT